jgi:hypothetical protein
VEILVVEAMRDLIVRGLFEPLLETVEVQLKDEFWSLPFSMLDPSLLVPVQYPYEHGLGSFVEDNDLRKLDLRIGDLFMIGDSFQSTGNGTGEHCLWKHHRMLWDMGYGRRG